MPNASPQAGNHKGAAQRVGNVDSSTRALRQTVQRWSYHAVVLANRPGAARVGPRARRQYGDISNRIGCEVCQIDHSASFTSWQSMSPFLVPSRRLLWAAAGDSVSRRHQVEKLSRSPKRWRRHPSAVAEPKGPSSQPCAQQYLPAYRNRPRFTATFEETALPKHRLTWRVPRTR